jgi:hypothetical protein
VVRTKETEERAPIDPIVRRAVFTRDRFRCQWCGADCGLQLDHIVPWSAGGSDSPDNLRTLCSKCNTRRSNYAIETDYKPRRTSDGCLSCMPDRPWEGVMTTGPTFCIHCQCLGLGPVAFDV